LAFLTLFVVAVDAGLGADNGVGGIPLAGELLVFVVEDDWVNTLELFLINAERWGLPLFRYIEFGSVDDEF
jgi:hypothetical protein